MPHATRQARLDYQRRYRGRNAEKLRVQNREYRRAHPEKTRQYRAVTNERVGGPYSTIWSTRHPKRDLFLAARGRAKEKELEFSMTMEDFSIPEVCPVLGIPLVRAQGKHTDNSPTIDRIDNKQGYIPGNVIVISYRANILKRDATPEELRKLAGRLL